ncbi:hypothetical protein EYF80_021409 [Liparis tanakae]|uniref:Uncharacterized protein n=1 Tax=Liparis tanakae TaxID=230148 RepID=A0A4Z2HR86_9TELE|nr:hypothetical protein EYF80_021409 [Liparis tanakae]
MLIALEQALNGSVEQWEGRARVDEVIVCLWRQEAGVRARDGVRPYVCVSAGPGGDTATCCQCDLFDQWLTGGLG